MTKEEALRIQFEKAVSRLKEVLEMEKNEVVRDSAIQRFEMSFDLSWKLVKEFLENRKGVVCSSPKDCFRAAFKHGLIDYEDSWISITDTRNYTVHAYSEAFAEKVYKELPNILKKFESLLEKVKQS
ncbi:MAG: HI0074 family nucleotidyltransferase substrate-binding subunit [bacterium]|nr:HI0074 family nucleotidyltransferase substrate-binding subunit [bacterium]